VVGGYSSRLSRPELNGLSHARRALVSRDRSALAALNIVCLSLRSAQAEPGTRADTPPAGATAQRRYWAI